MERTGGNGKGSRDKVGIARRRLPGALLVTFSPLMLKLISASLFAGALALTPSQAHARSCGVASFYGQEFAGSRTANGERFNPSALTAAHRSLPFGSRVRVTNQDNGRSVTLRINDYGPAYSSRIIDLSEAAFASIASTSQGLVRVCITKL